MKKVALEPDLGLDSGKQGEGPSFIQRAQAEGYKVRRCGHGEANHSAWPGFTGHEGH